MHVTSHFIHILSFFLLLSYWSPLHASVYDDDVLDIFSRILPRLVMMSNQREKIQTNMKICILHNNTDALTAVSLGEKLNRHYPNGIKGIKIDLKSNTYDRIELCQDSQLVFMFDSSKEDMENALRFSHEYELLSVSYDRRYLEQGIGVSLFLGRRIIPYINLRALRSNGIELNNVLLRISKIYEEEND